MNRDDRNRKMRSGELADMSAPELQVRFEHAKKLLARMRCLSTYDETYRGLLEELIPDLPATSVICPPFHCDHGDGIRLGEHVFVNANCTFLDGAFITIGSHTLIGPCVQIYTPHHPMDYLERRNPKVRLSGNYWRRLLDWWRGCHLSA